MSFSSSSALYLCVLDTTLAFIFLNLFVLDFIDLFSCVFLNLLEFLDEVNECSFKFYGLGLPASLNLTNILWPYGFGGQKIPSLQFLHCLQFCNKTGHVDIIVSLVSDMDSSVWKRSQGMWTKFSVKVRYGLHGMNSHEYGEVCLHARCITQSNSGDWGQISGLRWVR